jgi:hypothetical protein
MAPFMLRKPHVHPRGCLSCRGVPDGLRLAWLTARVAASASRGSSTHLRKNKHRHIVRADEAALYACACT